MTTPISLSINESKTQQPQNDMMFAYQWASSRFMYKRAACTFYMLRSISFTFYKSLQFQGIFDANKSCEMRMVNMAFSQLPQWKGRRYRQQHHQERHQEHQGNHQERHHREQHQEHHRLVGRSSS